MEQTNLEKSLSVIIDTLKQQNSKLVKDVEDLVSELCRITLLWDEMWLAALMQRQGEVHRCVGWEGERQQCDNRGVNYIYIYIYIVIY